MRQQIYTILTSCINLKINLLKFVSQTYVFFFQSLLISGVKNPITLIDILCRRDLDK
jgi:hypothetical protein